MSTSTPHPRLAPLLGKHGLTFEQFNRKGRLPADLTWILERRSALVTELHAAGTPWKEMTEITGMGYGALNRLSTASWNEASRKNVSEGAAERGRARKGEKKPWLTAQMKQAWSTGKFDFHRGKLWTAEQKERLRRSKHGRHGIWKLIETEKGGRIMTRSSWERVAAAKLDADPNVVRFQYEVKMEVRGQHPIRPDFLVTYVDGSMTLIEVKPKFIVNQHEGHKDVIRLRLACKLAEARGWGFTIWTEVELGIPTKYRESRTSAAQLPLREAQGPVGRP